MCIPALYSNISVHSLIFVWQFMEVKMGLLLHKCQYIFKLGEEKSEVQQDILKKYISIKVTAMKNIISRTNINSVILS